jgi:dipeptidyl-peptidase-4
VLHDDADPRVERLGLVPPELVTLSARDGTPLHAALHRPEGDGPFPTVVSVYGGPHAQRVVDAWSTTADMRAQLLCRLGFLVVVVDNRGSARRGLAFEAFLKHRLGTVEVDDQVAAVASLVERGLVDGDRVAIYGWSYGGYLAALCLARAPEVFRAAVAGAPVTHWEGYDTHYTERYMGTPAENPEGYATASVLSHVGEVAGQLLLIHGLLDENVHFRHTARLVTALVEAGRPHELLLFPDERHLPRRPEDRRYMEERVVEFLRPLL